jgi:2-keto-3-deoxy-L-rhamnonate aldolase RhmA
MRTNRTRRILEDGGIALGVMIFEMASPGVGRLAEGAGADFVLFDLEHTAWSIDRIAPALSSMRSDDVTPLVRVPGTVPHLISGALDAGALGVMVPMVQDDRQAADAVGAATFPPRGRRGYGLLYRDQLHPEGVGATMEASDRERLVIAQIETVQGVEGADAIAATDGVGVLWVGQYDLSASLGIPGAFDDPRMRAAEDRVVAACRAHDRAAGMLAASSAHVDDLLERGFRCIAVSNDLRLFDAGLSEALAAARRPRG